MSSQTWIAEAMRLADEYATYYDNHHNIEKGADQAAAARAALEKHLASHPG